jgi:hypothetical protein
MTFLHRNDCSFIISIFVYDPAKFFIVNLFIYCQVYCIVGLFFVLYFMLYIFY